MKTKDQRLKTEDFGVCFRKVIFLSGLLSVVCCLWSIAAFADDWLEGANGYARGSEQNKLTGKPMIIYFYTDWCGYCRKFEKHTLANADVIKVLSHFVKVRVNPEKGSRESQLATRYQLQGYPSVYFENPSANQGTQEMTQALQSVNDFVNAANQFAEAAQSFISPKKQTAPVLPVVAAPAKPAAVLQAVMPEQIIHLKNGRKVAGKIISEDDQGVMLATSELGDVYFSRNEIQKIEQLSKS